MANIFERDYSQASLTPKQRIEDIARKSRVPVNVLWGIGEIAGAANDDEKMALAQRAADEFGPRIQAGEDIKALIREAAGSDEAAKAFITRSRQIADELYPEQAAKARAARAESQKGGLGTALGVGVDALQQGYGSAVEGIGRSIGSDGIAQYGADVAARNKAQIEEVAPGLTGLDQIDGIGSAAKFAGETLAQQVPQLGVSIGAGMAGAAAGGAVAGPVGAAIGGIGAGIAANLPFFYGQNRERQKEAIEAGFRTEMDEGAAALTALPQAALDTIVDRLMIGAVAGPMMKAGGGLFTRVGRGAAQGVLAETPTEIGQAMLERAQAGLPLDSDDAIREYRDVAVAAGLIGGTVGGAGGAIAGKSQPAGPVSGNVQPPPEADGVPPQAAAPLALPAPERGGTIFGEGAPGVDPTVREREAWMPRSSDVAPAQQPAQLRPQAPRGPLRAAMEAGAPVTQPQQNSIAGEGQAPAVAQPMGAAGASSPLAEQPAPMGDPVSDPVPPRTLRTAADMAPAPLLGDMPAQSQIIINVPGLPAIPATFLGSTPLGIQISDADGEISEITREEIEGGAVTIEALQPAAPQGQMNPDEAQRRLGMIEDKARAEGWSRSLLEMRDTLQQIVARQAQVDQKADAEGSTIQPADTQGIPDGLGILGAGVSSQVIAPQAEVRNADQQQLGSAPELAPSASDAGASLAGLAEGGDGGAEGGQAVASIDPLRRDRPEGRSAVSPDGGGVDDAAAASQPDLALKEPDQEAESEDRAKAFMAAQRASAFAKGNKVTSKILPGRQAKGVPMAEIEVGKHPDGGFMVRHAFNTGQRGHATPFEGQFGTPEEAEAAATSFISDRARRILAEKAEQTDETERADARKVLKWLGGDMPSAVSGKDDQSADALAANARGGQIPPVEAPIPPAVKPARKSVKRANEERMARLRSHYAPGNIVQGYGGKADRVLSFDEGTDGDWTVRVQQVEKDASGEWQPSGDVRAHRTTPTEQEFRRGVVFAAPQPEAKPVIEDIRARAAILKGVPKEMPPAVAGVSLKWDQKEGGFIFSRKHSDAVRTAVMAPEPAAQGSVEIPQEADRSNEVMKTLVQADAKKPVPAQPDAKAQDFNDYIAAVLQTREWAITSPRGQHASKYQAHLSRSRFAEIKAQYQAERSAGAQGGEAAPQINAAAEVDTDAVGRAWDAADGGKRHQMLRQIGVQMKADGKLPAKFSRVPYMKWAEFGAEDKAALANRLAPLVREDASKAEEARRGRRAALDEVGAETLDAMEVRHREILGKQPFKNGEGSRFTDEIAVGARLARYNSAFDPSMNPAARKVFEEFTGVKLPKTIKGTKEVLERGPYDLKFPGQTAPVLAVKPAADDAPARALAPVAEPDQAEAIAAAAAETDPKPTPAQAEAENYRTGKARWNGLALSIENAKGSTRRKVTPDGKTEWEVTMPAHYGRILRTEGADGDHVDFYMGDKPESEWAYLVDQVDSDTGAFDEHKLMLGFGSREEAQKAYDAAFSDGKGPARRAAVSEMSVQQAKDWLSAGDTKKPYADLDGIRAKAAETQQAAEARAAKKAAKEAEDKRKALEDLRASVGRTQDLKGGTARAVVAWGDGDRFMDASGYNGHGKFVLRKGAFPEFDALVASKKPTLTGEGPKAGALRLAETAEKAKDEIEWRFVRNVSGKPHFVAGRVATKSPDGKAGFRWVEIDRLVHNFAQRNGLKLTAGDDPGIMALRRANGELVGFAAAPRPYMNAKGPNLDAMDAVANPPDPAVSEAAEPNSAPPEPEAAAQADEPVKAKKIEDFGEKIGGARKDMWAGFKEKMEEAERLDISAEPLSKTWPEPDYAKLIEGGIDPWAVSFIRAARDMIPRKPSKSWKLKGWADQVLVLRTFASDILAGKIDQARLKEKLAAQPDLNRKIGGRIALYEAVGHSKSLKDLSFEEHTYSVLDGVRFEKGRTFWEVTKEQAATAFSNMPKTLVRAETRDEAIEKFRAAFASLGDGGASKGAKGTKFLIYSQRGQTGPKYRIGVKIGSNYLDLRTGIEDVKEARRIVAEEANQLQAQLDLKRTIPNERRDENAPRLGADHRFGADVTPQQFAEAFGFRGVEFGNWVEDTRRQEDLNNAYDGLMDLASILDLPPKAISLNGTLGLAFGARGSGGKNPAAAHYEPGKVVINLTKRSGRGSLAHEWFHAMDNYFAKQRQQMRGTYITDNLAPGSSPANAGIRPEVVEAFSAVKRAIMATGLKERSQNLDKLRSSPYWGTGIEMHARAFESFVIAKLQDQDAANDYLANVVNGLSWSMLAEASGLGDSYPYLKDGEIEKVRPAFDELFSTIETRETDRGVELYSVFDGREPVASLRGDELGEWQDIRQLGRKAEAWYRENLIGSSVVNAASGMEVLFRREGAKKVSGRKGDVLLRIVPALREILADGVVIASESDAKGNADVLAWHTIAATVMLDGAPRDVVVKVKETRDGKFHYDLSRDVSDGARHMRASGRVGTDAIGLEDNPADLNIGAVESEINAVVPVEKMRALSDAVQREVDAAGLAGKVTPRVVRGLLGASGIPVQGRYRNGDIEVNAAAADAVGVARHEIIHALRDPALWGASHGLFTPDEWRALVRAARADKALMERVEAAYADRSAAVQVEEAVAEQYRQWAAARDGADALSRIFEKVRSMFRAIASALRGEGFTDAALVMERIATGEIGGRGPDGPGEGMNAAGDMEMRDALMATAAKAKGMIGRDGWRTPSEWLTDAMAGFGDGKYSLLALVPGRALFTELGKKLVSAKAYLRMKEEMDAMRNGWHQTADDVAQEWLTLRGKNAAANEEMMDLMHRATLAGIDPSKPDVFDAGALAAAKREVKMRGPQAQQWAQDQVAFADRRAEGYAKLKERFDALPPEFQEMYRKVLETYSAMADDFDKAVLENIQNATRIGLKRAERDYEKALRQISDDGLTGKDRAEAMQLAKAKLDAVKKRGGFAAKARISALRKQFESNRLKGPYFPLARFGTFFVTVRDADGKVSSFSRFESEKQQMAHVRAMEEQNPGRVQHGTMDDSASLKSQVDPTFVADVERILAESGADFQVMDAVWQRWLETLPDQSIRTAKIHRKGREGWNRDAFRAFSKHMFHGAHQLARLKYAIQMEDMIEEARLEARRSDDPNRLGLIVNEMDKRHKFTMEPTGSAAVASMSSLAFVWYLGATPAAALANISQTTVVGVPVMAARFKGASLADVLKHLGRASADFGKGRGQKLTDAWSAANSEALSADERAAMAEAYRRGTVDRTQAHDLASVAETGIEYNAARERVMKAVGWFFHHAERFNREVTFLAGYRLARAEGLSHESAVDAAADVTWKTHYDYQNTARPRFMQNDMGKILTQFRQFTVNTLWRLFRDAHQTFKGESPEVRAEAKTQLIGITLSMMAHAGIRGTWGYGLAMLLLGALVPGAEDDDIEAWLQDALLMEGDTLGVAAWNFGMGAALNGAPGQILGVDLRERIGMPNLWFRGPSRDLEGEDLYMHYVGELLGPTFGIGAGLFRGFEYAADGEIYRGVETAVPKVIRDAMKAGRYGVEGVVTKNGDDILPDVNPWQLLLQASGFTPAQIAERYDINSRLKNQEIRITERRQRLHKQATSAIRDGKAIPESVVEGIRAFNGQYPEYPITPDSIRQSLQSRLRASARNEFGVALNPKLNDRLRAAQPPQIYN